MKRTIFKSVALIAILSTTFFISSCNWFCDDEDMNPVNSLFYHGIKHTAKNEAVISREGPNLVFSNMNHPNASVEIDIAENDSWMYSQTASFFVEDENDSQFIKHQFIDNAGRNIGASINRRVDNQIFMSSDFNDIEIHSVNIQIFRGIEEIEDIDISSATAGGIAIAPSIGVPDSFSWGWCIGGDFFCCWVGSDKPFQVFVPGFDEFDDVTNIVITPDFEANIEISGVEISTSMDTMVITHEEVN